VLETNIFLLQSSRMQQGKSRPPSLPPSLPSCTPKTSRSSTARRIQRPRATHTPYNRWWEDGKSLMVQREGRGSEGGREGGRKGRGEGGSGFSDGRSSKPMKITIPTIFDHLSTTTPRLSPRHAFNAPLFFQEAAHLSLPRFLPSSPLLPLPLLRRHEHFPALNSIGKKP